MNYKIGNAIGKGAFATVFHAKDIQRRRNVALKQIEIANMDPKALELCKKEVELLRKANSVNIIKCYETFCEKSYMYVSLEFADAGDLEKLIHNQQKNGRLLSERTIWYYFHQICCGLGDLHEKRILHRDLKPANVFMNSKGIIKIGDLGLSRIFSAQTIFAQTCNVGTEYYMAPERNVNGGYNFKSDIWSLGCLLYELCTYRSPFNGETINVYALHKKISEAKIFPLPSDIYSDQIQFFINCCLSIKSSDRPTSEEAYQAAHRMFIIFEDLHHKYYQNKKFVS
uniref:Protein kinase domain-containing protein n=1 Tax=Panagrolaimus sp. PS1159 TaxID=55785 RepID=A0AC35GVM1_9BILA